MPLTKTSHVTSDRALRISSPLEAGESLLGYKQLPLQLTSALEYVSTRLMRKKVHVSLIVVRKDVQIPQQSPPSSPSLTPPSQTNSPVKSLFNTLRRVSSRSAISDSPLPSPDLSRCSSPSLSECSTLDSPNPYGLTLQNTCALNSQTEKILRHYISRAEKKFFIGSNWLPSHSLTSEITCPKLSTIIRRSLAQNNPLFTSEGLTLFSLDAVYTFKHHLHTYSHTLTTDSYTLAINELRRLVLSQNGRQITKSYLLKSYDWLGVSLAALVDINEGYKSAYGGPTRTGGIDVRNSDERRSPPAIKTAFTNTRTDAKNNTRSRSPSPGHEMKWKIRCVSIDDEDTRPATSPAAISGERIVRAVAVGESAHGLDRHLSTSTPRSSIRPPTHQHLQAHNSLPPTPRPQRSQSHSRTHPRLLTHNSLPPTPRPQRSQSQQTHSTTKIRPRTQSPPIKYNTSPTVPPLPVSSSGDLNLIREDRGPHRRGAKTPNGFEDITPVTRGEWLCLMVGDGWLEREKEIQLVPVVAAC